MVPLRQRRPESVFDCREDLYQDLSQLCERVDEHDHQSAPEAVTDDPDRPSLEAGGGAGVKRGGPYQGSAHPRGGDAEPDDVVGSHVLIDVLTFAANKQQR